jgi:hypothetical protein
MGLKDSIKNAVNINPKLTIEQELRVARADSILASIAILRAIRKENCKLNCMPSLKDDVELCRQLRSAELLKNIRK